MNCDFFILYYGKSPIIETHKTVQQYMTILRMKTDFTKDSKVFPY